MCRHGSVVLVALVAILLTARSTADEVTLWLERHGLVELLAVHLEDRIASASGDERDALVARLASIYTELLGRARTEERRREIEARVHLLLESVPEAGTHGLRLELLRASYRGAMDDAEQWRLRTTDETERASAQAAFAELVPKLVALRRTIDESIRLSNDRLGGESGTEAVLLAEEIERDREVHAQCTFLTAWSMYYLAWFDRDEEQAREGQRLFAELLDFRDRPARAEDVSVDLRANESIAQCILGQALCRSLTSTSSGLATEWLDLLEHERTWEPLRKEVPAWRLAIHLEAGEFVRASEILDQLDEEEREIPAHWLRLVAVHALEAQERSRPGRDLARVAVTRLAASGELAHVFDIAERYGVGALGTSGFAARYVGGAVSYYEARERHGGDEPTSDAEAIALYGTARDAFDLAQHESDAAHYHAALADCRRLIAWCEYFRGNLLSARDAFLGAAAGLPPEDAAEALWMAIVCLERLVSASPEETALARSLDAVVEQFLLLYPSSEHAPVLVLRRTLRSGELTLAHVDELLAIPTTSPVHASARVRAAQILYDLFRGARADERIALGNRYLSVAVALFASEAPQELDDGERERWLAEGRRILEVSLHDGIDRLVAARGVLDAFQSVEASGAERSPNASELAYRRVQERLSSGDAEGAAALADALDQRDAESVYADLASRAILRYARRRWREIESEGGDVRPAVDLVVRYGLRVVERSGTPEGAQNLLLHATVVRALEFVCDRDGDEAVGRLALEISERLLEARPRNEEFLRACASLGERFGSIDVAIERWRLLVAGTAVRTDRWYEAKVHLLGLLARTDPARARAVLDQHRALDPEYGPEPWGSKLRALDESLPSGTGASGESEATS